MKNSIFSGNSSKGIKKWAVPLLKAVITALFWLTIWQIASMAVNKEILLPSPIVTFQHLVALFSTPAFIIACGISLIRIMLGFLVGCIIGFILAVLCHAVPFFDTLLTPLRATVKATPVASFIIIAYMWLTKSEIPGFISALIVIPIIWSNISTSLENTDKKLLEVGKIFSFSPWYYIKYIYFPAIKPYMLSAMITGVGLAWKSGIAAEVLVVARDGMGGLLYESKIYFESADMFAITVVIIAISLAIESVLKRMAKSQKPSQHKATKKHRFHTLLKKNNSVLPGSAEYSEIKNIITVDNVSKQYNNQKILENISLVINSGERIAIMGASGKGKTTLIRLICRLEKPDFGVADSKGKISVVFQEDRLFDNISVYKNVYCVCRNHQKTEALLQKVLLWDDKDKLPSALSGGMARRVALARALAYDHHILILDEPFKGLDVLTREQMIKLIDDAENKKTIIIVTHDTMEAKLLDAKIHELGN